MPATSVVGQDAPEDCTPKPFIIPLPYKKGNAATADVLERKTFTNKEAVDISGTMTDRGAMTFNPGTSSQRIPEGYHDGFGTVTGDANLIPGNIKTGVTVFGVTGVSVEASGTATPEQVLSGQTFTNASGSATGSMTNVGTQDITPGTSPQSISQGYHDGTGSVAGDEDLVSGNIRSGADIFGVAGNPNVVNTSTGNAVAVVILSGKKAWVDGSELTGSMDDIGVQNITPGTTSQNITQGYHNGSGSVMGDSALIEDNIKSGVTIFGISGESEVVDTEDGDAVSGDLLSGKKAYVDGALVTGTMATQILSADSTTIAAGYYAATYYVDSSMTDDSGDGLGWLTAKKTVQAAIDVANISGAVGNPNEVWVKAGVHTPVDQSSSFVLKPYVKLYGGFDGTETVLSQRDYDTNHTILSCDLTGDDQWIDNWGVAADGATQQGAIISDSLFVTPEIGWVLDESTAADNCYNVVTVPEDSDLDANTIFDGFVVTGGYQIIISDSMYGSGINILDDNSIMTLKNITVSGNTLSRNGVLAGSLFGAGICIRAGGNIINISDCTIRANMQNNSPTSGNVYSYGAGLYSESQLLMAKCDIVGNGSIAVSEDNFVYLYGTGMSIFANNSTVSGSAIHSNKTISSAKNLVYFYGGGLYLSGDNSQLVTSTVNGNVGSVYSRDYYIYVYGAGVYSTGNNLKISDCSIENNVLAGATDSINSSYYARLYGGGLYLSGSSGDNAEVVNCTVTNNSLTSSAVDGNCLTRGAGIYSDLDLLLINSTVEGNSGSAASSTNSAVVEGGGLYHNSSDTGLVANSIFWNNSISASSDSGTVAEEGEQIYDALVRYSVVQDGYLAGTDINTSDPELRALADNGGDTQTMSIGPASSAIDGGVYVYQDTDVDSSYFYRIPSTSNYKLLSDNSDYTPTSTDTLLNATDQRGESRPMGSGIDIGSYERDETISIPTLTTDAVTSVTHSNAVAGGEVTDDGNLTVTERGVCWSTSTYPTTSDDCLVIGSGVGTFSDTLTNLTESTTYYLRAYATNLDGTAYGDLVLFYNRCNSYGSNIDDLCGPGYYHDNSSGGRSGAA